MKTNYSHLITVPARRSTLDPDLMRKLAKQMLFLRDRKLHIIGMPEGKEACVGRTAELLFRALVDLRADASFTMQSISETFPEKEDVSDPKIRKILELAIEAAPNPDVIPVLVMDLSYAEKITRVFLWDFLENRTINPNIDQVFKPGEAGVVDCKTQSRNTLHPEGDEVWENSLLVKQR